MHNFTKVIGKYLCVLLVLLVLSACTPFHKPGALRARAILAPDEREVAALTHFSYAQYLAQMGQPAKAVDELRLALTYDPQSALLREALAFMLYQQGKLVEGLAVTDEGLKLKPDSARLHNIRGQILVESKKIDEGQKEFRQAMALAPNSPEFVINLADSQLRKQKPDEALATLQAFATAHPADVETRFYLGVILQASGKNEEAGATYRQLLEIAPGFYPAARNLFTNYLEARQWELAAAAGRDLLLAYPDDAETRITLSRVLVRLERDEEAIIVLEQGKALGPNPGLWVVEGFIYLDQEQPEQARKQFEGALEIDANDRQANYGLGQAAMQMKDFAEAKKQFELVAPGSPFYFEAQKRLAWLALQAGDPDRAMALIQAVYDQRPADPDAAVAYAAVARECGQYDLAEAALNKAIAAAPDNDELRYELAILYSVSGDEAKARAVAEEMVKKNPNDPRALNFLGYSLAEKGERLDEAEKLIRRALELSPNAGYILDSLGWVYFQRGDYQTALKYLQDADRETGPDPEILEHLGDCFVKLGRRADARAAYTRALDGATPRVRNRIEQKRKELK